MQRKHHGGRRAKGADMVLCQLFMHVRFDGIGMGP